MGCRPSRSALGKVADTSQYDRGYLKEFDKNRRKLKENTAKNRRKAPTYSDFSSTSRIYNRHSRKSKVTIRLSTDGSMLEVEQYDVDYTTVQSDVIPESSNNNENEVDGNAIERHYQSQPECEDILTYSRCESAPLLSRNISKTSDDYSQEELITPVAYTISDTMTSTSSASQSCKSADEVSDTCNATIINSKCPVNDVRQVNNGIFDHTSSDQTDQCALSCKHEGAYADDDHLCQCDVNGQKLTLTKTYDENEICMYPSCIFHSPCKKCQSILFRNSNKMVSDVHEKHRLRCNDSNCTHKIKRGSVLLCPCSSRDSNANVQSECVYKSQHSNHFGFDISTICNVANMCDSISNYIYGGQGNTFPTSHIVDIKKDNAPITRKSNDIGLSTTCDCVLKNALKPCDSIGRNQCPFERRIDNSRLTDVQSHGILSEMDITENHMRCPACCMTWHKLSIPPQHLTLKHSLLPRSQGKSMAPTSIENVGAITSLIREDGLSAKQNSGSIVTSACHFPPTERRFCQDGVLTGYHNGELSNVATDKTACQSQERYIWSRHGVYPDAYELCTNPGDEVKSERERLVNNDDVKDMDSDSISPSRDYVFHDSYSSDMDRIGALMNTVVFTDNNTYARSDDENDGDSDEDRDVYTDAVETSYV